MIFKPEVGKLCSFYHEGGHGERRWGYWRHGTVRAIPSKGHKLGLVQIELPVKFWLRDPVTGSYAPRPSEKVWADAAVVNAPGDTLYHGAKTWEIAEQRRLKKEAEQDKADKKARRLKPRAVVG